LDLLGLPCIPAPSPMALSIAACVILPCWKPTSKRPLCLVICFRPLPLLICSTYGASDGSPRPASDGRSRYCWSGEACSRDIPPTCAPNWSTSKARRSINPPKDVPNLSNPNDTHPARQGFKTTAIGIAISVVLAVVKAVAGILGHSFALIADAVESVGDIFTASVLCIGLPTAAKPPDQDHPYGHGKAEPLVALVVVLGLVIAAGFIAYESIGKLTTRHYPPAGVALVVLAVVILVKEGLSRYVSGVGESVESQAIKADGFHHRSDAITSGAAFIGISIALLGGPGYEIADDWAALGAAVIILGNAFRMGRPALGELMDKQPNPEWLDEVEHVAL